MSEQVINLDKVTAWLDENEVTCRFCDAKLHGCDISHHAHEGGYHVEGFQGKRWVYVTCHGCGYKWSLPKLWRNFT